MKTLINLHIKKQIATIMLLSIPYFLFGQISFEISGINYKTISTTEVAVTAKTAKYSGDINIPDSVTYNSNTYHITSIDDAFMYCSDLTTITIPNSLTFIPNNTFNGCTGLTDITIAINNPNYSSLDGVLFDKQQKTIITCPNAKTSVYNIPESVTSIMNWAFMDCKNLTSVNIPNSVISIGFRAFRNCSGLTSITIPNSVKNIGDMAFVNCTGLTSITIPNALTSIGNMVFQNCTKLTSITIPNSVSSIGVNAFIDCSELKSVSIPNSMKTIGDGAFWRCKSLSSVLIPSLVSSIGSRAFADCYEINEITVNATTPPAVLAYAFKNVNKNITIYVPKESVNIYKNTSGWKDFFNIVGNLNTKTFDSNRTTCEIRVKNESIEIINLENQTIKLFNTNGHLLYVKSGSESQETINVSQKGVYLLEIGNIVRKIIID